MIEMLEILALVDDIQAGDCSELADHPIHITPGKTLVAQLNIYVKGQYPESSPDEDESRDTFLEDFSQPNEGSAFTHISGKVTRSRRFFISPSDHRPKGETHVELLAIAREIPVSLWYSFDGEVDVKLPVEGNLIRVDGSLYCEPGFAYGKFYSPVKADIIETRMLKRKKKPEIQDWGILKLRLRSDISRFDLVGDDPKEGAEFARISSFNPPQSFWQAYLERVEEFSSRWKKTGKKKKKGV